MAEDRDKARERWKRWYLTHKEEALERNRAYNRANRDKQRARRLRHRNRNLEKARTAARLWQQQNPERVRAQHRAWMAANPEKGALFRARREARRRGAGGSYTLQEWLDKCALFANLCAYCGEAKPLTRDHNVPLTRGGSDYITNIVPACKSCNSRKRTKTAEEFLDLRRAA